MRPAHWWGDGDKPPFVYLKGDYTYYRFPRDGRGRDGRLVKMPNRDYDSREFKAAWQACEAERTGHVNTRTARVYERTAQTPFAPGMVGWFIAQYLASAKFTKPRSEGGFADGTKKNYRLDFDLMRNEIGDCILGEMTEEHVEVYTARIVEKHGGSVADRQRHLLSNLWRFAKRYPNEFRREGRGNPTLGAEKHYQVRRRTKAWDAEVQEKFLTTGGSPPDYLVLAYFVLRFTGQRGGDATKLLWSDLKVTRDPEASDPREEEVWRLRIVQEKTGTKLWHRLPADLADLLRRTPRICDHILTNAWRRPWGNATTLSHAIRRRLIEVGVTRIGPKGVPVAAVSMHGLRSTVASELAPIKGAFGIKSVTGHKSDKLANQYAADHDQLEANDEVVRQWDARRAEEKEARVKARRRAIAAVK